MIIKRLSVFIVAILLNSFASCEDGDLTTRGDDGKTCITRLAMCELDAGKHYFVGKQVDPGAKGPAGPPGLKGEKGLQGMQGLRGPKGNPGTNGKCGCDDEVEVDPYAGTVIGADDEEPPMLPPPLVKEWGTKEDPGNVTCRNAPITQSDTHYVLDSIKVFCEFDTKKTCVSSVLKSTITIAYNEDKPFWLSKKDFTLKDMYNLESNQLSWLQRQSYSANLTIRYHCKNSRPISKHSKESLSLLSWNDLNIGPESTETSPFHYDVANDGCSKAKKDTWSYTDIILFSPIAQRLPIIDFYIRDVGKINQALQIEIKELCFG